MSDTENSFADRLQRGRSLPAATSGFQPPFAPADDQLLPANFEDYLESLDGMNMTVAEAMADWQATAAIRSNLVTGIKDLALRAVARVKSNALWKIQQPAVKAAADALRGYRTPKPKLPADAPPALSRQKGDQSYGDIKALIDKLVAALKKVSDYDTGAPADISTAGIAALSTQLDGLNQLIAGKEQTLAAARATRKVGYDGANGLKEKMLAIKEATKAQYGGGSAEYLQVKGIRV